MFSSENNVFIHYILRVLHNLQCNTSVRMPFSFFVMYHHFTYNVTWSREMSHSSKIYFFIFFHHFIITLKCFILMQTPLQLDIWLQSYEWFINGKNNIKQRNLNTVFANISKTTSPTSDSFLLIMSPILSGKSLKFEFLFRSSKIVWCYSRVISS